MGKSGNALGLTVDQLLGPMPDLSAQALLAAECWAWCDGWAPERWPAFAAFHDVPDWGAVADLMRTMRDETRKSNA